MKKISKVLVFVLAFVTFVTFESKAQEMTKENFQVELENGVVSFVRSVKPVYTEGMSLKQFKLKLIGQSNFATITPEGDALIAKSFTLISKGSPEDVIKKEGLKEFSLAVKYIFEYQKANNIELSSDKGSVSLFGGNADGLNQGFRTAEKCRWYQVGCHIRNLIAWIESHPNTIGFAVDVFCFFTPWC